MAIVSRIQALKLPDDQFVVIGGGLLDALGLRASEDVDLAVSDTLFTRLAAEGWQPVRKHDDDCLERGDVEVWRDWGHEPDMSFTALYSDSVVVDGIHFVNPRTLLAWKRHQARDKDLRDVKLLEEYLAHESV